MNTLPDLTTTTYKEVTMASYKPNWDIESDLYQFECALDTLDLISDGLPDDIRISNALNGLHDKLSKIHADFKTRLMG